jgi:hypothetical protein
LDFGRASHFCQQFSRNPLSSPPNCFGLPKPSAAPMIAELNLINLLMHTVENAPDLSFP